MEPEVPPNKRYPHSLPWLLLLLVFSTAVYKAVYLSNAIFETFRVNEALQLLIADWRMLGAIFVIISISTFASHRPFSLATRLLGSVLTLWYITDTFLLLIIGHKFSLDRLAKFIPESSLLVSFIEPLHIALFILLIASPFARISVKKPVALSLLALSTLCFAIGIAYGNSLPQSLLKYRASISDVLQEVEALSVLPQPYRKTDIDYFAALAPKSGVVKLPDGNPNIIVVVVEGLSAIDSHRTSGLQNNLPQFDKLSEDGMLFARFFANHSFSSGGLVSIFQGIQPIPFPGAYPNVYRSFTGIPAVPETLRRHGYHTEMLQGSSIRLLYYGDWAQDVGFDLVAANENTAAFENEPRYALNAPSDKAIFKEAIRRVTALEQSKKPYLFGIQSASTHPPFLHPKTGSSKEEDLIRYTDRELGIFYQQLSKTEFFKNGILIITGDHRKQSPITDTEWTHFGDSAPARVPLAIIGKGIPKSILDQRLFQQSDLFSQLSNVPKLKTPLSDRVLFTEWTGSSYLNDKKGNLLFFELSTDLKQGFRASVFGRAFRWTSQRPLQWQNIEHTTHASRVMLQTTSRGGELWDFKS